MQPIIPIVHVICRRLIERYNATVEFRKNVFIFVERFIALCLRSGLVTRHDVTAGSLEIKRDS
jgi:hypothetical protein